MEELIHEGSFACAETEKCGAIFGEPIDREGRQVKPESFQTLPGRSLFYGHVGRDATLPPGRK